MFSIIDACALTRQVGAFNAAAYYHNRAMEVWFSNFARIDSVVFVFHKLPRKIAPKISSSKFDVYILDVDDALDKGVPILYKNIKKRRSDLAYCIAAFVSNECVGYRWLQMSPHLDEELRCIYMPYPLNKVAWGWNFYIAPEYRATRLFTILWQETDKFVLRKNGTGVVSWIPALNPRVLSAEKQLGAIVLGRATFFRMANMQVVFSNLGTKFHVSLTPSNKPTLAIETTTKHKH